MTDTATPAPVVDTDGTTTFTLSPILVGCLCLIGVCVGVWVGFKIADGNLEGAPCSDCEEKRAEAVAAQGLHVRADGAPSDDTE